MPVIRHPFTRNRYDLVDGAIEVTDGDGRSGRFRFDGSWISGEIREADPQLCNWIGGKRALSHRISETS
ncbi:MAG: transposase [Actinomycetota bacterium]